MGAHAADRRRHAVSELRRFGDGRKLRGARHPLRRSAPIAGRRPISTPFHVPLRWLSGALAVAALALVAVVDQYSGRSRRRATSCGRISAFRPTAAVATRTTRGSWISCGSIPRGTCSTGADSRLRPTMLRPSLAHAPSIKKLGVSLAEACPSSDGTLLSARRPRLSCARRCAERA